MNSSVYEGHVLKLNVSSMHQFECLLQYILNCMCHLRQFVEITATPSSGVFTATTASLVALWVATMTVFGAITAVLSWQYFKQKQKGLLGHMDDMMK